MEIPSNFRAEITIVGVRCFFGTILFQLISFTNQEFEHKDNSLIDIGVCGSNGKPFSSTAKPSLSRRLHAVLTKVQLETHSLILHILTKNRKFKTAVAILEGMVGSCRDVDVPDMLFEAVLYSYRVANSTPNVFDSLFKTYAWFKRFRNVTDTFRLMKDHGFLPTVESCNVSLSLLLRLNRADIALAFYGELRRCKISPSVFTLNMKGLLTAAEMLKSSMERDGLQADRETVRWEIGSTRRCLERLKADMVTYNALIMGLCKGGKTEKAAFLCKKMDEEKLFPNSSTFSALIHGQCLRKNSERAFQLYKIMIRNNLCPNIQTYDMLISTFCKNEDFDGAVQVTREMLGRAMVPSSDVLAELFEGICRKGSDDLVLELWELLKDRMHGTGQVQDPMIFIRPPCNVPKEVVNQWAVGPRVLIMCVTTFLVLERTRETWIERKSEEEQRHPDEMACLVASHSLCHGSGVGQPNILTRKPDEPPGDIQRLFPAFQHPDEPIYGSICIVSSHGLVQCTNQVVMLLSCLVIIQMLGLKTLLGILQSHNNTTGAHTSSIITTTTVT
ncbi:Pentatricopeptide repeat-containing protein [Drosera capensis]